MKKTNLFLTLLIFSMIMLSGCEQGNEQGGSKTKPFVGGTRGLSIQFSEGAPPDEVFDGNSYPFDVELKLLNIGEADVSSDSVSVRISGINPVDFGKSESDFIRNQISEDVLATQVDSEGNKIEPPPVFVSFQDLMYSDTLVGNALFPIRADVCYTYQTQAFADGCVSSNPLSPQDDAICRVNEAKEVQNSGAPIHIAEFREQPSGSDKIRYVFKIMHKGSGRFYSPGSECPLDFQTQRREENRVHFQIESRVEDLVCSGLRGDADMQGEVLLINGEATIHCTQQTSSNLDFIDKIKITLTYDYKESTEKTLLVKKSLN
ncbi:hypothetical protein GF327_03340 [Candidatus Woesearchaeota archaeon]|nr:hypothetical protein [Candidatus Woesearchaeota archaeon]